MSLFSLLNLFGVTVRQKRLRKRHPRSLDLILHSSASGNMRCVIAIAVIFAATAYSLAPGGRFASARRISASALRGNKLDGIEISGDLTPMSNSLLVKVKEALAETKGGLYIPDNAKERPTEGLVISAGPGRIHPETANQLDIAVQAGQCVMYGQYDGSELKYNDEDHQIIKDDDALLTYPAGEEATIDNVLPVKDQVLIKLPIKETTSVSGIIITSAENEKRADYGEVVKVGPGRQAGNMQYMKIQVAPGDGVRFRDFAGTQVKLGGSDYLVIRAYDILAKW